MYTPDALTGALVKEIRGRHKLSRAKFSQLAGFTGKSTARLYNIETNNQWKPGDRESVSVLLNSLESGVISTNGSPTGGTFRHPATSTATSTDPVFTLQVEDPDDASDGVVGLVPGSASLAVQEVTPTVVERFYEDFAASAKPGVYRVSNSELQTWKRCRRKWWLAWYRNLTLQTEAFTGVRATGTRVHRALQQWYVPDGERRVDPRDALERVIVDDWTKVAKLAAERSLASEQLTELAIEFANATNLERAMVEGYVQWLEETGADAELRIIASETPLAVDLEVEDLATDDVIPVQFIGLLDTRAHRTTDGVNLFIDHKTVGDLQAPVMTLPQNEQMLHYHLIEFLTAKDTDGRCDGALYNMLRRVKRSARAKPPFYDRIEVRHNVFELDAYKRRALATTRDVLTAIDRLNRGDDHFDVVYPSPKQDCRWDCDFFAVCNLFDDGSRGVNDMVDALYREQDPRERYEREIQR